MEYLAWPSVVLVLGIVGLFAFKRNIAGLIDRIRKIERLGITTALDQTQSLPESKTTGFQELMDLVSSPLLRQREVVIRDSLKAKGVTGEQEAVKLLTRAVAALGLQLQWEQLDRSIYGSQVALMIAVNASARGLSVEQIKGFYDTAAQQFPATYKSYAFEEWLSFLEAMQMVVKGGGGYMITLEGKEFMSWLVQTGRTHPRPN
jgi:hypothetical protein